MTTTVRLMVSCSLALGLLAGCAATAGRTDPPSPTEPARPEASPDGPARGGPDAGAPNEGGGGLPGGGGGGVPGRIPGQPELVVPRPGQQMLHPVAASELIALVEDGHLLLNVRWWSGVEPCAVLDSVEVVRDGTTFTITLIEGTSDLEAACIMVAVEKVVAIDLGAVDSGAYTVRAQPGDAPPVTVTVP